MVFSSLEFIFRFIPIFFLVYFLVGPEYRTITLLIGSLLFYAYGEPKFVFIMCLSILFNYYMTGIMAGKKRKSERKNILILIIVVDFLVFFIFKYLDFGISILNIFLGKGSIKAAHIALPIGISFYTFQMVSYVVDVYRRKIPAADSLINCATYICMFPQLIAGPIVNYSEVSGKLERKTRLNIKNVEDGVAIFIVGLCYKVILANHMSMMWDDVTMYGVSGMNTKLAWLGAWGYSFQIYFDFFGYSLMAIGLGKMLGFQFPENFKNPYVSKSCTEFWRRWHITLGRWFREYVYIPLGGSRNGTKKLIISMLAVWGFTGLWHGASWNFVLWGLMFFVFLLVEKFFIGKYLEHSYVLGHVYMLIIIPFSWIIFKFTNFKTMGEYLKLMLGGSSGFTNPRIDQLFGRALGNYWWLLLLCIICSTPYPMRIFRKYRHSLITKFILVVLFWVCIYSLASAVGNNPFLYFRF